MKAIGEQINYLRKYNGYTLKQLAQKSNISVSYLCDIEKGRSNPSLDTLKNIAAALKTTPSAFFAESTPIVAETAGSLSLVEVPLVKKVSFNKPLLEPANIEKTIHVSIDRSLDDDSYIFYRVGDSSMTKSRLLQGDLVLVKLEARVTPGDLVLVAFRGKEAAIRLVHRLKKQTILIADSPDVKPVMVDNKSKARILGKVIRAIINFD